MSKIVTEKRICDRCGKILPLYPSFKILRKKLFSKLETRSNWGDGYPIDNVLELCSECKKDFYDFMDNKTI